MADVKIKSLASNTISYVTFVNRHSQKANIYWHNFEGLLVKYASVEPNATYGMKTFVNHPWSVTDSDTGEKLLIDNAPVYYPTPNPGAHIQVYIDTPTGKEGSDEEDSHFLDSHKKAPAWIRKKKS